MSDRSRGMFGAMALVGLLLGGCASDESGTTKNIDRIAAGAVEDSLKACMARIPKDASAGQRMLAEESCRRDQANRR